MEDQLGQGSPDAGTEAAETVATGTAVAAAVVPVGAASGGIPAEFFRRLVDAGPVVGAARMLAMTPADELDGAGAVAALIEAARVEAWAVAKKAELAVRILQTTQDAMPEKLHGSIDGQELALSSAVSEIGCALHLAERTAGFLLVDSENLIRHFPATHAALAAGELDYARARTITNQAQGLPEKLIPLFESTLLTKAAGQTNPQLGASARRLRDKIHPEALAERKAKAAQDRSLTFRPAEDGMAYLEAFLPAEEALAAYNSVTAAAIRAQGPHEPRTLTQLRADLAVDFLLNAFSTDPNATLNDGAGAGDRSETGATKGTSNDGGTGGGGNTGRGSKPGRVKPKAQIMVMIPMLTMLGLSQDPAELDGYGPIPADTARELAGEQNVWFRLLTDPASGVPVKLDRNSYRIPESTKAWLRLRDGNCRFPGCGRQARFTDADHTIPYPIGPSNESNLACLCPKHHQILKHRAGWKATQTGNGDLDWQSPAGHTYTSHPRDST